VDRDATDSTIQYLALAGMNAGPDAQAQFADAVNDVARTREGSRWTVERGEKPVACGIDLLATRMAKCFSNDRVVPAQKLTPSSIAK